jgi:gas vesicle protein
MRTGTAFVWGTIVGAVVAWLWGREIGEYVEDQAREARSTAAAGMRAVEEKTGALLDRSGSSLRRAEDFLQDTKEHVSRALRAGQDAIRPAATTGEVS